MSLGLNTDLILATIWSGLIGFLFVRRHLSFETAAGISFIKVTIPFCYFAWFYDGQWNFLDDISYFYGGINFLQKGFTPMNILLDERGWDSLSALAGGRHILYYWWNILGQYLFGQYYFAPIFLNVMLVFLCSNVVYNIAKVSEFKENYAKFLLIFVLFHPEITVWSSFVNLKDTLVMTLTATALYFTILLTKQVNFFNVAVIGFLVYLFSFIRFYVPVFIFFAFLLWIIFLNTSGKKRVFLFSLVAIIGSVLAQVMGISETSEVSRNYLSYTGIFYGIFRMALTPLPWSIDISYSFLLVPSIIHWILIIPAIFAGINLWRQSTVARLLILYLMIALVFYGATEELQGPRHRVQVTFIVAWLQFHALWMVFHSLFKNSNHSSNCPNVRLR
ncbi:MAG: hypothetical protein BWK78_01235 [Thiotrichaceae bacterium IS1]|nr:MAG: hypothetical protein BWK78_01235 [Thiotrichaceae bacterium IS1]